MAIRIKSSSVFFYVFLLGICLSSLYLLYSQDVDYKRYRENTVALEFEEVTKKIEAYGQLIETEHLVILDPDETLQLFIESSLTQQKNDLQAQQKEAEIQARIERVRSFFIRYNAVLQGYEELIVRTADACGGDYRLLIGIAGNESGLGRSPYKLYNPYGYLNGVQYSSWEESLEYLTCKISQQHLVPCDNDIYCVIQRYGGDDTDEEKWIRNVTWFMNQI